MKNTAISEEEQSLNEVEPRSKQISKSKKPSLREGYLLEMENIQNEFGNLTQILSVLGISQRRACQLLLVDPSAWTRWNKTGAPPHIFQALKWLIQLKKMNPEAIGPSDLSTRLDYVQTKANAKFKSLEENLEFLQKKIVLVANSTYSVAAPALSPFIDQERSFKAALLAQKHQFQQIIQALEEKVEKLGHELVGKKNSKKKSKKISKKKGLKKNARKKYTRPALKTAGKKKAPKKSSVKIKRKINTGRKAKGINRKSRS